MNEAGVYAGYDNKDKIDMDDIIRATMRIIFRAPEMMSDKNKKMIKEIAYHEAGHAVIAEILEPESVSIVSVKKYDGDIGGITSYYQNERYFQSKRYMENRILSLLGGKVATEIAFGDLDVGASNDISRCFRILDRFVGDYCFDGFDKFDYSNNLSDEYKARIENSIHSYIRNYYTICKSILVKNREFLDKLANALTEKETLIMEDVQKIKQTCNLVKVEF